MHRVPRKRIRPCFYRWERSPFISPSQTLQLAKIYQDTPHRGWKSKDGDLFYNEAAQSLVPSKQDGDLERETVYHRTVPRHHRNRHSYRHGLRHAKRSESYNDFTNTKQWEWGEMLVQFDTNPPTPKPSLDRFLREVSYSIVCHTLVPEEHGAR
jgi:hypothetical protein